jgi:hypothetical protein
MTLLTFATTVDYNLLQEQKRTLLELYTTEAQREHIDGLINFIDAFQDAIVESNIKSEEEVFSI